MSPTGSKVQIYVVLDGRETYPNGAIRNEPVKNGERKTRLARMSYADFLTEQAGVGPEVIAFYDDQPKGLFCVGVDALPALYAWAMGYPGFQQLDLHPLSRVGPLTRIPEKLGHAADIGTHIGDQLMVQVDFTGATRPRELPAPGAAGRAPGLRSRVAR